MLDQAIQEMSKGFVRAMIFVMVLIVVGWLAAHGPLIGVHSDARAVMAGLIDLSQGGVEGMLDHRFAFGLASLVAQIAVALVVAVAVDNVLFFSIPVCAARREVERGPAVLSTLESALAHNVATRRGWAKLKMQGQLGAGQKTSLVADASRFLTLRTTTVAYQQRILSAVPGLFVSFGLFLTFVGLVLSLGVANGAFVDGLSSSGPISNAGMTTALSKLLDTASFKFATSIAGLGSSILLSIAFKVLAAINGAQIDALAEAVDAVNRPVGQEGILHRLRQEQAMILEIMRNFDQTAFFMKLADTLSPAIQKSLTDTVAEIRDKLTLAIAKMDERNTQALNDLLKEFIEKFSGGTVQQMEGIAATLQATNEAIAALAERIEKSGGGFEMRMAEAASHLASSTRDMLAILQDIRTETKTASGVAAQTVSALLDTLQKRLDAVMEEIGKRVADEGAGIAAGRSRHEAVVSEILGEALRRMTTAFALEFDARLAELRSEINRMRDGLSGTNDEISKHIDGSRQVAETSVRIAEAMNAASEQVASAAEPLVAAGLAVRMTLEAASEQSNAMTESSRDYRTGIAGLVAGMREQAETVGKATERHVERFGAIDEQLGKALIRISEDGTQQQKRIEDFARELDHRCADAVKGLSSGVHLIREVLEDVQRVFEDMREDRVAAGQTVVSAAGPHATTVSGAASAGAR